MLCGYVESMSVNEFIAIISKAHIVNILLPPNVKVFSWRGNNPQGVLLASSQSCKIIISNGSYKSNVV